MVHGKLHSVSPLIEVNTLSVYHVDIGIDFSIEFNFPFKKTSNDMRLNTRKIGSFFHSANHGSDSAFFTSAMVPFTVSSSTSGDQPQGEAYCMRMTCAW